MNWLNENWSRARTVWWLKWRLASNQFKRHGLLEQVVSMLLIVGAVISSLGALVMGLVAGAMLTPMMSPDAAMMTWDVIVAAFLVGTLIVVITDLQQSESLSLQNFLHLPVTPFNAFLLNFAGSFLNLMVILFVPGLLGFALTHWAGFGQNVWRNAGGQ